MKLAHKPKAPGPEGMQRGLIIEDLAATAEWLLVALREAFPGMNIEHAETLAEARLALGAA